jgi:hypothetical protein
MDEKTLKEILDRHKLWLESRGDEGDRANLCNVNLSRTDLHYADLSRTDLHYANLSEANLRGVNLSRTDLHYVDLSEANLRGANLRGANLYYANLSEADLHGADLREANLRGVNLSRTDLHYADLSEADLRGADLRGATNVPFIPMTCPDSGSFIGWKKASSYIVKLLIPEDARRSSSTGRKCRTDKAIVLAIENIDGSTSEHKAICSSYDSNFMYRIGEAATVDNFDENRFNECAPGIHFFINRQEAVEY